MFFVNFQMKMLVNWQAIKVNLGKEGNVAQFALAPDYQSPSQIVITKFEMSILVTRTSVEDIENKCKASSQA